MKNWKTSLFGLATGFGNILANGTNPTTGKINWWAIGVSVCIAALGLFAKDRNVTGGDTVQR